MVGEPAGFSMSISNSRIGSSLSRLLELRSGDGGEMQFSSLVSLGESKSWPQNGIFHRSPEASLAITPFLGPVHVVPFTLTGETQTSINA